MPSLKSLFKTFGPRIIGLGVSVVAGLIYDKTKGAVQMDAEATTVLVTTMIGSYAAGHRAASAVINPGDAATARVAEGIDKAANDPRASDTVIIPPKT